MLRIFFGDMKDAAYGPTWFKYNYDPSWFNDELVQEMIREVDFLYEKSRLISRPLLFRLRRFRAYL